MAAVALPFITQIVRYALTAADVNTINYRRQVRGRDLNSDAPELLEHGSAVTVGQLVPMIVTNTLANGAINGQAFLDGDDSLWVTGVLQGTAPGTWQ